MNRRTFIATCFIAGLMSQFRLRGRDVGAEIRERQVIVSVWLGPKGYSTDRGETWIDAVPPDGVGVERIYSQSSYAYMEAGDARNPPTYRREAAVQFDGTQEMTIRSYDGPNAYFFVPGAISAGPVTIGKIEPLP